MVVIGGRQHSLCVVYHAFLPVPSLATPDPVHRLEVARRNLVDTKQMHTHTHTQYAARVWMNTHARTRNVVYTKAASNVTGCEPPPDLQGVREQKVRAAASSVPT